MLFRCRQRVSLWERLRVWLWLRRAELGAGILSALALGLALLSGWAQAAHTTRRAGADICRAG